MRILCCAGERKTWYCCDWAFRLRILTCKFCDRHAQPWGKVIRSETCDLASFWFPSLFCSKWLPMPLPARTDPASSDPSSSPCEEKAGCPVRRKSKSCEGGQNCERKTTNAVQETDETARGKGKTRGKQHPTWFSWLLSWVQRADQESYTCYVLFVLIFILDFSLLTMLFPVSLAAYALATQRPSRLYWQVSLFVCCAVLCCAVLCYSFALSLLNFLDASLEFGLLVEFLLEHKMAFLILDSCHALKPSVSMYAHMSASLFKSGFVL